MNKLLLLGSLICSSMGVAQQLDATIDGKKIKIGEPIRLEYKIPYTQGDKIQFPQLKDTLSYHIEIIDQKLDTVSDGKNVQIVHQIDLTAYDEGNFLIPTVTVEKNGSILRTPSFEIEVQTVEVDTVASEIKPIKPVMKEEYTARDYWNKYWIYGIAALILFIIALVLIILFIRSKSKNLKSAEPKTPYEEAIFALKSVDAKKYLKRGEQQEYYTQLSLIVRRYVGKVYHFSALELLSDDIIQVVEKREDVIAEDKTQFRKFMFDADLAKFAKQEFDESKNVAYRQWIGEFVERIKPLDIPEEENETEDKVTGEKYRKWDNS